MLNRKSDRPRIDFGVIIPARYASTRLPGKPLCDLGGQPMIVRVLENARAAGAQFVLVATDDERIAAVVRQAGGDVVMTSSHHISGTDRIAEAVERKELPNDGIVVNVQGDEPGLSPHWVQSVARTLALRPEAGIATMATPFAQGTDFSNPNDVKVVLDASGFALYFSRAAIPFQRRVDDAARPLRHVGLYAYRVGALKQLAAHGSVPLERTESLEQLRALWLGIRIHVEVISEPPPHGVDTEEDLRRAMKLFAGGS